MKRYLLTLLTLLCLTLPVQAQQSYQSDVSEQMNQAIELVQENKYAEALDELLQIGKVTSLQRDSVERQINIDSQIYAVKCYFDLNQYVEAFQLADSLLHSGQLTAAENERLAPLYVLSGYLYTMEQIDNLKKADFQRARQLLKKILPYADAEMTQRIKNRYAYCWYAEASVLSIKLQLYHSVQCYDKAAQAFEEIGNKSYAAKMLCKKAEVNKLLYRNIEALDDFSKALTILRTNPDEENLMLGLIGMWTLQNELGDVKAQNKLMTEMENLNEQTQNVNVKLKYYEFRGGLALEWQQHKLSEIFYQKILTILKDLPADQVGAYNHNAHCNLRSLYLDLEKFEDALRENELARQAYMKMYTNVGDKSFLFNFHAANLYASLGNREQCQLQIDTIMMKRQLMSEVIEKSYAYQFSGQCYQKFKEYDKARADFFKADSILATKYDEGNSERVLLLAMLAGVEYQLENYAQSEAYYTKFVKHTGRIYGHKSMQYASALLRQADIEGYVGHTDAGRRDYIEATQIFKLIASERLPFISSAQRESLWKEVSPHLVRSTAYAVRLKDFQSEFTASCYDALVLNKAFLLETERSIYDILKEGNEEDALHDFALLSSLKAKVRDWEKNYQIYSDSIMAVEPEINRLDQILTEKSRAYGDITSFMDIDYQKIKKSLGKHEVLIDFTDYAIRDNECHYAAYVIDARQRYPLLVNLFNETQFDSLGITRPDMYYDADFAPEVLTLLWDPIKKKVRKGDTIYYVPSRLLFNISLESLPLADGSLLGDHYHFVRLSSARELVQSSDVAKLSNRNNTAVLYGGLEYNLDEQTMAQNAHEYDLSRLLVMRGDAAGGVTEFLQLPGSLEEVERIEQILHNHNYQVSLLTGKRGSEESFLNLHGQSPQILHLATHGFYYSPEKAQHIEFLKGYFDAMSLSGLVMSGGNAAWMGKRHSDEALGGILTGHQIARIDLRGTEMVVLSACQSGQGAATSEGLFGLQRAFKKAGVGTILMTLWSISDQKATEFMVQFYECLADSKNKWDKRKAFAKAQKIFRARYPDPYYWAAFIMLD